MENTPGTRDPKLGTPFAAMSTSRKVMFVAKLCVCILTLGMAFPNVMGD
jgi:hypothetical protein